MLFALHLKSDSGDEKQQNECVSVDSVALDQIIAYSSECNSLTLICSVSCRNDPPLFLFNRLLQIVQR